MATEQIPITTINPESYPWFALQVRPRYEKIVASALASKGYEGFLPLYRYRSRWSDRVKENHAPLFPGYMSAVSTSTSGFPYWSRLVLSG